MKALIEITASADDFKDVYNEGVTVEDLTEYTVTTSINARAVLGIIKSSSDDIRDKLGKLPRNLTSAKNIQNQIMNFDVSETKRSVEVSHGAVSKNFPNMDLAAKYIADTTNSLIEPMKDVDEIYQQLIDAKNKPKRRGRPRKTPV